MTRKCYLFFTVISSIIALVYNGENIFAVDPILRLELSSYYVWKNEKQQEWEELGIETLASKVDSLITNVDDFLDEARQELESKDAQAQVLYIYNFLTELLNENSVTSWLEVDQNWLDKQAFKFWKQYNQELWQEWGKTTQASQISLLVEDIEDWLYVIRKKPHHTNAKREALYTYNYLREIFHSSFATSYSEIDQSWLEYVAQEFGLTEIEKYNAWKEEKQTKWQYENKTSFISQVHSLLKDIHGWIIPIHQDGDPDAKRQAVYCYNFLRELLDLPVITSFSQIDYEWPQQVTTEAAFHSLTNLLGGEPPTPIQMYLIQKAQGTFKLDSIRALSFYYNRGASFCFGPNTCLIALDETPDIDEQIFTIYHELSHIFHKDTKNRFALMKGEANHKELLKDQSLLRSYNDKAGCYQRLAIKSFDKSTPVGRHITDIFSRYPMLELETVPEDTQKNQEVFYMRATEKRADLFALEKLLEDKRLSIILSAIEQWAFGTIKTETEFDHHPSNIQRALYMAGFLIDKGIDINKAFRDWYAQGKCKTVPHDLLEVFLSQAPKSQGARDFIKACDKHEKRYIGLFEKLYKFLRQRGKKSFTDLSTMTEDLRRKDF